MAWITLGSKGKTGVVIHKSGEKYIEIMIYNHFLFVLKWSGMFIYHVRPYQEKKSVLSAVIVLERLEVRGLI